MRVKVEFSGGLDLLFGKVKAMEVELPNTQSEGITLKEFIAWMRDNKLQERPELFVSGDSVRPGILVLVNDVDWELVGTLGYRVAENDTIVFISTLHGG